MFSNLGKSKLKGDLTKIVVPSLARLKRTAVSNLTQLKREECVRVVCVAIFLQDGSCIRIIVLVNFRLGS